MIRVAVIGCGKIAQVRHLPEYATNPNAQLVAYYDKNSRRAHEVAAQYGGKVYDSYFDLLKDPEIDAVSVCVENRSHAEMTTAALYAGKHVLCEKPMAVTLAECESMVAAAEFNNRHLMIGHNMRFDPVHRRAKELLEQGVIGDVITFRTGLGTSGPEGWSMEGNWFFDKKKAVMGALSDLGIHKIDLMQYLTGQTVIETTAKILTLNKHDREDHLIGVDDNALCILRMNGGQLDGIRSGEQLHLPVRHPWRHADLQQPHRPYRSAGSEQHHHRLSVRAPDPLRRHRRVHRRTGA
mgnify:CR=1 FL=1